MYKDEVRVLQKAAIVVGIFSIVLLATLAIMKPVRAWVGGGTYRYPIYQRGSLLPVFSVNNSNLTNGVPVWARADNNSYLYCTDSVCTSGVYIGNDSAAANYEIEGGAQSGLANLYKNFFAVYHFNGTSALDATGNGKSCTYTGTHSAVTPAVFGSGIGFSSDTAATCSALDVPLASSFTVSFWFNASGSHADDQHFFYSQASGIYIDTGNADHSFNWGIYNGGWPSMATGIFPDTGVWSYYAIVHDCDAGKLYFYKNGAELSASVVAACPRQNYGAVDHIGNAVLGSMDEMKVRLYAMSVNEMLSEYNNGIPNNNYTAFGPLGVNGAPVEIGGLANITYGTSITPYCFSPGSTCTLLRNGSTQTNNTAIILGVGAWNYTATETGGNKTTNYVLVKAKAFTFGLSPANGTVSLPNTVYINATSNDTAANSQLTIWHNNTNTTNATSTQLAIGYHVFVANITREVANYSWSAVLNNVTVKDTTAPTCVFLNQTPTDITDLSSGLLQELINCTDASPINLTNIGGHLQDFASYTLYNWTGSFSNLPNAWSIRPPNNSLGQVDSRWSAYPVFRSAGRGRDFWYESNPGLPVLVDNYSYAVEDGHYGYLSIKNTSTANNTVLFNFTSFIDIVARRQNVYLSWDSMVNETKKNYTINATQPLLVKLWDLDAIRGEQNYTVDVYRDFGYIGSPGKTLRLWYCNSSYVPNVTTVILSPFCVLQNSLVPSDINNRIMNVSNSQYSRGIISSTNGLFGGIKRTPLAWMYLESPTTSAGDRYQVRYATGSTVTNLTFAQTNVAWASNDSGATWITQPFTPDVWRASVQPANDLFSFGVWVQDVYGNAYSNMSFITDTINNASYPITAPLVLEYNSSRTINDTSLNGTHMGMMQILVGAAKYPGEPGNVSMNLTLRNPDGTWNFTINGSFNSPNDADIWINFDTALVPDGFYRMNISAYNPHDTGNNVSRMTNGTFQILQYHPVFLGGVTNTTYGTVLTPYCYSPGSTCTLLRNGSIRPNNTAVVLPVGGWNYTVNETGGNQSGTWATISHSSYLFTLSPANSTVNYGNSVLEQILSNVSTGDSSLTFWRNGVNITVLNGTTEVLGAGTWIFWANSTVPTENITYINSTTVLTVSKKALQFTLNPLNATYTYPQRVLKRVLSNASTAESQLTMWANDTNITGLNQTTVSLNARAWIFQANSTVSTDNYTYTNVTDIMVMKVNNTRQWVSPQNSTITYGTSVSQYCAGIGCELYRNDSLISNLTTVTFGVAAYKFTSNVSYATDPENYTNVLNESVLVVTKASPTLTVTGTTPLTYEAAGNFAGSTADTGNSGCAYAFERNGTSVAMPDVTVLGVGDWNYIYSTLGCQNYTAGSSGSDLLVNKKSIPTYGAINGTEVNTGLSPTVVVYNGQVSNVTGFYNYSLVSSGATVSLTQNGTVISNPQVVAQAVGGYVYNFGLSSANYTATNVTGTLEVRTNAAPVATVTAPANATIVQGGNLATTFYATNDDSATFSLMAYLDGAVIYSSAAYVNNTVQTYTITPVHAKVYNITLVAVDSMGSTGTTQRIFTDSQGIFIDVINANSTVISLWNATFFNTTASVDIGQNNNTRYVDYNNMTGGSSYIMLSRDKFGTRNVSFLSNDTMGLYNLTASLYRLQQFNVLDPSASPIGMFFVDFNHSLVVVGSSGVLRESLEFIPLGSAINVTFGSPSFRNSSRIYNFNLSSEVNDTITFSGGGISFRVLDENYLTYVPQYKVDLNNGTFQNYFTVGKSNLPFLDDSTGTYITADPTHNTTANYSYAIGGSIANFSITWDAVMGVSSYGGNAIIMVDVYNNVLSRWDNVYDNLTNIPAGPFNTFHVTNYFTVNNTFNSYGDFPQYKVNMSSYAVGGVPPVPLTMNLYEIEMLTPYTYDLNGVTNILFQQFGITSGLTRMKVTSPAYSAVTRIYYVDASITGYTQITAFMSALCYYQNFNAQTTGATFSAVQLPDVLVTIYRLFGTTLLPIAQEKTNSVGPVSMCIEAGNPYYLVATKPGYTTVTASNETWYPSTGTANVVMSTSPSTIISPLGNIEISITPPAYYIPNSSVVETSCSVNAPDGDLLYMFYTVSNSTVPNASTNVYYNTTVFTPIGAIANYNLTKTDKYYLQCGYFASVNGTNYRYNITNTLFYYAYQGISGPGASQLHTVISSKTLEFIAIIIAAMATGFIVKMFGVKSAFIFLLLYGFIITAFGDWGLNMETGILAVATMLYAALIMLQMG